MSGIGERMRGWMGQKPDAAPAALTNVDPNATATNKGAPQNDGINDEDVDAIWKDVKKETTTPAPTNVQPTTVVAAKEPAEQVKDYMKSVGLEPVALTGADIELLKSGDPDGVARIFGNINQQIQKAHIESVKAAQTLVTNMMPKMVEEAVAKSKGFVEGKELRGLLQAKFEWAKDSALGPVAETLMQRFLDKGASRDEALQGVDKWAQKFVRAYDPTFTPNTDGGGNFKQRTPSRPGGEDLDWMSALKG